MKNKLILAFICTIFCLSCEVDRAYTNRPKDKAESQKIVDEFYTYLIKQQPKKATALFSKGSNAIDTVKLKKIFSVAATELGKVEKIQLDSCSTKVIEGSRPTGEYFLYYTVIHEKYKTNDVFKLKLENDEIKISDFRMNPSMRD